MRTLEAISISKTILDNLDVNRTQLIEDMTKSGFVSVDGEVKQYQPRSYDFISVNNDELKHHIVRFLPNNWACISLNQIINDLEHELPQLTSVEVSHFKAYVEHYQMEINTDLINNRLNEISKQNNEYQDLKVTINGGRDMTNQLIIMKQNNIFTDHRTRYLYKLKDGEFLIFKLNDVMGLLNSYLTSEDNRIRPSDIQRNRLTYLTSLDDIHDIRVELSKKKNRESILKDYEDDYKKILKILKNY